MRIFISLLFVLALGIGIGVGLKVLPSSGEGEMQTSSKSTERKIAYWAAPMDPNYRRDEPGQSPMGMDLVPVYEDELSGGASAPEGAIKIDPTYVHTLGIKTAEVTSREFGRSIRAFGKIAPSTRLEHAVDVRTKGWIVDLATDAVGDTVKKGDLLFTFYSPDLMTAQSDYLIGARVGNAEQRLRLFGMDEKSIAELKKQKKFLEKTPFYAPVDGTVTMLNVRKGAHVNEGGSVMMIQDFSKLWINVDVPIRDVQFLAIGTPAKVTVPETGDEYETVIDFIHPVNDPQNRTVMVRLILENPDGILKSDTYVDVDLKGDTQPRLTVPQEAVLYGGQGAYVMEDASEGYFRPVMVKTGITANGLTEIKTGLKPGQNIVTSGQFMLDAETNLKGGMEAMGHDHGG
ncbi:MAG: hypothetical protein DHS20C02_11940 [Micavibrio sp.]|nr:MAG: hypothetical protein DHS20C02_11940 [Micavibrio sp.]